jgi:cysteine desulfurase
MEPRVYLDNNATTALDPRVLRVMVDALENLFGNPSSAHTFGQIARQKINEARRAIALSLGVRPQEVIFTSGGTEGVNCVLKGFCQKNPQAHIISSMAEHACVYATLRELERDGHQVSFLSPGLHGAVTPEAVKSAIQPHTGLICLMAVNNETGVKTDISAIAAIAHEAKIPFFVDAVAWLGKETVVVPQGVSALCFSGHKIHASKGIGFLVLRAGFIMPPLLIGGGQEFGKRGGTENVAGI